jgi:glycosyltransferase involved in cell wall biosynthesis
VGGLWFPCPKESEAALTDSSRGAGVLGLFPSFGTIGGVQASGQLAWRGITRSVNPVFGRRSLISYGRDGHGPARPGTGQALAVSSKLGAAAVALRRRWPAHVVLVWHLDLLKYLFLLRLSNARTVLFLHGIEAWKPRSLPVRALLRRVHRFLSNSDHTWERFVARCPELREAPHCTVHLGIGEAVRGEIPRPASTPIALMISRLLRTEDYKGHREVIDAWPLVTERVPGAELWIVGDGDLRADLEAVVQGRGLAGKVRLLGVLPEVGKEEALIRSRCLLMPSRAEGFGLVYLEAMRVARPCLVSTIDAGREVVNPPEAGLAVNPADPRQLADAVARLLSRGEEWESWSRRARRRYEDHFTAARFEQRLVSALSEIAGGDGYAT